MWALKATTVPVVMGAICTIKEVMENYSNKIPVNTAIYMNSRKLSFLQPTFSRKSSPSYRNLLCLPKSTVWTRMLREKIACNYTSISYIVIIIIIKLFYTLIITNDYSIADVVVSKLRTKTANYTEWHESLSQRTSQLSHEVQREIYNFVSKFAI